MAEAAPNPKNNLRAMSPTGVTGSTIAMLKDTCGNLIQLTQLAKYSH